MANHKSAAKRARQSERKSDVNSRRKSTVRTWEKKLRKALDANNVEDAKTFLAAFTRNVDKAAQKGVVHARTAARKISRLARRVDQLKGA